MMIRVLTILAAVVALAVSAAPASAGSNHRTATYGDDQTQTYLELDLETTSITSYTLDWEYWNPFGL
jgi:hypothetical protein